MAVEDLHRWDRSKHNGIKGHFNIKRMCDLSGQPLIDATLQYCNDDDDDKRQKYRVQQCHHMTMQGLQQVSTLHSYKVSKRMVNYATTKRRHSSDMLCLSNIWNKCQYTMDMQSVWDATLQERQAWGWWVVPQWAPTHNKPWWCLWTCTQMF